MANQLENIGLAMQGFGAGIQGNLPQFQQAQNQKQQMEFQQEATERELQLAEEKQRQEMLKQREQAMFQDAQASLNLAEQGDYDSVAQLGMNRLQSLQNFPDADPSGTQTVTKLALAARNGNEEAQQLLKEELESTVEIGRSRGILERPERDTKVVGGDLVDAGSGEVVYSGDEESDRDFVQRVTPEGETQSLQWDGKNFYDLRGNKVNVSPDDRIVEGSSLTGSSEDLGLPSSEASGLRDAEVAARNMINTTGDALKMLQETPDINTFAGRAASVVNNLQQEGKAVARSLGVEFDEDMLDPSKHKSTFDDLGIQNQRMRSMITSLAFQSAAASGQSGRSVSDRDVRRFIEEIGASAADPRAFAQTLNDVASRTARNFKTNYEVRTNEAFEDDLGLSNLPTYQEEGEDQDPEIQSLVNKYLNDGNN